MRRALRIAGTLLILGGALTLAWTLLVWQWQDPFTALYTKWKQHQLASQYQKRVEAFSAPIASTSLADERRSIAREAKRYRTSSTRGEAIGRIRIPRMGVNLVLVNGTDHETLKKGPGRDGRTFMPGENRLIYIAGHRTTYGTFIYAVTHHHIVKATDLSVLRSPKHEVVELQACHPRFFASHRYIAYARLLRVEPRGAKPYELEAQASGK
jgi:sortase A